MGSGRGWEGAGGGEAGEFRTQPEVWAPLQLILGSSPCSSPQMPLGGNIALRATRLWRQELAVVGRPSLNCLVRPPLSWWCRGCVCAGCVVESVSPSLPGCPRMGRCHSRQARDPAGGLSPFFTSYPFPVPHHHHPRSKI